jgi:urease gamma subunit
VTFLLQDKIVVATEMSNIVHQISIENEWPKIVKLIVIHYSVNVAAD